MLYLYIVTDNTTIVLIGQFDWIMMLFMSFWGAAKIRNLQQAIVTSPEKSELFGVLCFTLKKFPAAPIGHSSGQIDYAAQSGAFGGFLCHLFSSEGCCIAALVWMCLCAWVKETLMHLIY